MIEARLGRETEIWLATVREDERPHLVPVWFIWLDEKLYISTATLSQKWVNLLTNQHVALSLPDPRNVVIFEGIAHATGRALTDKVAEYFFNKYEWDFRYDDSAEWRLVEVTINKVLDWGSAE